MPTWGANSKTGRAQGAHIAVRTRTAKGARTGTGASAASRGPHGMGGAYGHGARSRTPLMMGHGHTHVVDVGRIRTCLSLGVQGRAWLQGGGYIWLTLLI
jgi:hypothetical protein